MKELEEGISEKERLMEQLTRSQRAFHSMKQRYEMKMNEMEASMREMNSERATLMKDVERHQKSEKEEKEKPNLDTNKARKAEAARAEAEGRLQMLDIQIKDMRKKQKEAERVRRRALRTLRYTLPF